MVTIVAVIFVSDHLKGDGVNICKVSRKSEMKNHMIRKCELEIRVR